MKLLDTAAEFHDILNQKDKEKFVDLFTKVPLGELDGVCYQNKINIGDERQGISKLTPKFYKVEIDEKMNPKVSPLQDDAIWDTAQGGLDRSRPFILINSGNDSQFGLLNSSELPVELMSKKVATGVKIQEECLAEYSPKEPRQYLVTINEQSWGENMALIKHHNSLEGEDLRKYSTPYSEKQVAAIYAPLIFDEDGQALPSKKIVENLSKSVSFNPSFGSFSANCQTNALLKLMRGRVDEETIKESVESMHRFDAPNMVKIQTSSAKYPSNTSVVFHARNDTLASDYGAALPAKYSASETQDGITYINTVAVPDQVYDPTKKITDSKTNEERRPTKEEIAREDKIVQGLSQIKTSRQIAALGEENKFRKSVKQIIATLKANSTLNSRTESTLKDFGLDGFRFSDGGMNHLRPHLTSPATPGHEVIGRDPDLFFKMMGTTLTDLETRSKTSEVTKSWVERVDSSRINSENQDKQSNGR